LWNTNPSSLLKAKRLEKNKQIRINQYGVPGMMPAGSPLKIYMLLAIYKPEFFWYEIDKRYCQGNV
jgi:hypothetical protein